MFYKQTMTTALRMDRKDDNLFYCKRCNEFLPSDKFYLKRQEYLCHKHLKERNRLSKLGTHRQRALNSLRNKAYQDLNVFGFKENHIHYKEIMQLLTPEQERSFTYWCIVPKRPDKAMTLDNAILIPSSQRRYLITQWKLTRDPDEYERILNTLMHAKTPCTTPMVK